jgi:hypothetical protein
MTAVLPRYFALKGLELLLPHLPSGYRTLIRSLMEALADDRRAVVANLHTALFLASTATNAALNRLLATLNRTAGDHGMGWR